MDITEGDRVLVPGVVQRVHPSTGTVLVGTEVRFRSDEIAHTAEHHVATELRAQAHRLRRRADSTVLSADRSGIERLGTLRDVADELIARADELDPTGAAAAATLSGAHDDRCEAEYVLAAPGWTACACARRAAEAGYGPSINLADAERADTWPYDQGRTGP